MAKILVIKKKINNEVNAEIKRSFQACINTDWMNVITKLPNNIDNGKTKNKKYI